MINHNENEDEWKIDYINRHGSRHGRKYSKYKKCLSMMMLVCVKQHLSNISSSINEKPKRCWGWVENERCL